MTSFTPLSLGSFEEFVRTHPYALIHFWAAWNGVDIVMSRFLQAKTPELLERRIAIGTVNVDENDELCMRHQLRILPTIALYRGGDMHEIISGMLSAEKFAAHLNELTGTSPGSNDSSGIP